MKGSEDAVSTTFAFIIAVGIMTASIVAVFQATDGIVSRGTIQETEQVNLQSEAAALQSILLDSPGVIAGGGPWDEATTPSADDLLRLGLLQPNGSGVQLEKLHNLRLAPYTADGSDGYANYEEVRTSLGLDDKGLDFHVRAKPSLGAVEDILNDPNLRDDAIRVTYIGDVSSAYSGSPIDEGLIVDSLSCAASPTGSPSWRFSVDITNGGTQETQFFIVMDITNDGTTVTRQDQTDLVAAGATATAWVDVENTADMDCDADTTIELDILDPVQLLRTELLASPTVGTAPAASSDTFWMTAGVPYVLTTDELELAYYGENIALDLIDLRIRPGTDPDAVPVHSDLNIVVPIAQKKQTVDIDVPVDLLGLPGEYTAYLTHLGSDVVATQRFLVDSSGPGAYVPPSATGQTRYEENPSMAIEIDYLHSLVKKFCPTYFDDKTNSSIGADWDTECSGFKDETPLWDGLVHPGDVFPDLQKELWDMESRLLNADGTPRYDITNTIVVGSNVAHNSMTSNNFGRPLEEWVLGGGTLIVFGSPGQSTQWLQNLFHAGQTSSSGGISAPDTSHPLLSTPEQLSYEDYDTSEKGWTYTGGADDFFTDVVKQGDTPVTAVSDPGDFGEGTIVLTSWLPYDLFGDGLAGNEGLRLVYNFVMHHYRDLFVDYGPPIPDGVAAIPAAGRSYVDHEDLGPVTLDFTLYVFPGGS